MGDKWHVMTRFVCGWGSERGGDGSEEEKRVNSEGQRGCAGAKQTETRNIPTQAITSLRIGGGPGCGDGAMLFAIRRPFHRICQCEYVLADIWRLSIPVWRAHASAMRVST